MGSKKVVQQLKFQTRDFFKGEYGREVRPGLNLSFRGLSLRREGEVRVGEGRRERRETSVLVRINGFLSSPPPCEVFISVSVSLVVVPKKTSFPLYLKIIFYLQYPNQQYTVCGSEFG